MQFNLLIGNTGAVLWQTMVRVLTIVYGGADHLMVCTPRNPCTYMDYYSFTDPKGRKSPPATDRRPNH